MKNIPVLFENDFCMVLSKPAGLAVQGGEGISTSLDSILSQSFPNRPLLVHRLDRDTSGLILTAKNREAAAGLSSILASKTNHTVKQYLAVVSGIPEQPEGTIRLDLEIRNQTKKSETFYRLLNSAVFSALINEFVEFQNHHGNPENSYSLLELELGTGRIHQIRRHLKFIGHPVLGDDKYGDFTLNKYLRKTMGLKRLLLHSSRLIIKPCIYLPLGLDIKAELPEYFMPFFSTV